MTGIVLFSLLRIGCTEDFSICLEPQGPTYVCAKISLTTVFVSRKKAKANVVGHPVFLSRNICKEMQWYLKRLTTLIFSTQSAIRKIPHE